MSDFTNSTQQTRDALNTVINKAGSQRALAKKIDLTQQAVCAWVRLGYVPIRQVNRVIKAFDGFFKQHDVRPDFFY